MPRRPSAFLFLMEVDEGTKKFKNYEKGKALFFKKKRGYPMGEPDSRLVDIFFKNNGESNRNQKIER